MDRRINDLTPAIAPYFAPILTWKFPVMQPDATNTTEEAMSLSVGEIKAILSLDQLDNTADADKPISSATAAALAGKQSTIVLGTTAQYFRGNLTLATFPTSNSAFTNDENYITTATGDVRYSLVGHTHAFADLTAKPTTLGGYGITDAVNVSLLGANNGVATLDAGGKLPISQLPLSVMTYMGVWNANTNSPALIDGTGDLGDVYRVGTTGSQNLGSGVIAFTYGDYVIYNGTTWEKSDGTDAVTSVNGQQGVVVLTTTNIAEGTNLYYTDARVQTFSDLRYSQLGHTHAFSSLSGIPTTLAGYGITDPIVLTSGSYANPSWITSLAWSKITGTPTTIGGYGITDFNSLGDARWSLLGHTHTTAQITDFPSQTSNSGKFLTTNGTTLSWAAPSNIYNSNGTLSGNRTITGSNFYLAISGGRFEENMGANVVAANDLTLGGDGNTFTVTGNTQINALTSTNWQAGSNIAIIFTGSPTVKHNTAGGAGTSPILLSGSADYVAATDDVLELVYNGTAWHETTRKIVATGGGKGVSQMNNIGSTPNAQGASITGNHLTLQPANTSFGGVITSTDWNTFNNKQAALSGTGFVKISGTTISYDNSTYLVANQTITLSGDVSGSGATSISTTVTKINGVSLAGLATGILKNTTTTGVPSIAVAADFPTLNQSTTGSAATLTTSRNIQGVAFNGSANIDIINGTGFVKASGTTISYDNSTYLTTSSAASTYQPLDTDLTTIAGLTATTDNFIVSVSSAWASRTPAQVRTTLGLQAIATSGSASDLSSGTLPAARIAGTTTDGYVATLVSGVPTWQASTGGGSSIIIRESDLSPSTTSTTLTFHSEDFILTSPVGGETLVRGIAQWHAGSNLSVGTSNSYSAVTTADNNIAIGTNLLNTLTTGDNNIVIGKTSFSSATTISNWVVIGKDIHPLSIAGKGYGATGIGIGGTLAPYDSRQNILIGFNSFQNGLTQVQADAGTTYDNISIGWQNLEVLTDGYDNLAFGYETLSEMTTGSRNNAMGEFALTSLLVGDGNAALGWEAGGSLQNGSGNVYIGDHAGGTGSSFGTFTNTIAIGNNARFSAASLSNATAIGDTAVAGQSNIVVLGKSGTFLAIARSTATESIHTDGAIIIGTAASTTNGTIRYTGTDFEGRLGGVWTSFTAGGGGGETNTASNLGGGLANYSTKVGVDLQFNSFSASDFNLTSNLISLDYVNGQTATASVNGFLSTTDWSTFNNKQATLVSGTNIKTINSTSLLGSGNIVTPGEGTYVIAASDTPALLKARADYICDGTADEAEINTALALGNVTLCEGTFNISTTGIQLASYRTLAGQGDNTKLVAVSYSTTTKMITATGTTGITVKDLMIDGASHTMGYGIFFQLVGSGAGTTAVTGCTISGVYIKDAYQSAIELQSCRNSIITNSRFSNPNWDGIVLRKKVGETKGCINITVSETVHNNSTAAVWGLFLEQSNIVNNIFEGDFTNGRGQELIQLESTCVDIAITGNTLINSEENGMNINDTCLRITITGNTVRGTNSAEGIYCLASDSIISNNTVSNCGTYGIYFEGTNVNVSNNIVFNNSTITHNTYDGINTGFASDVIVSNNNVSRGSGTNKQRYGIKLDNVTRAFLTDNHLYDSGTTGDINTNSTLRQRNNISNTGAWKDLLLTASQYEMSTGKLIGRTTASQGVVEEITVSTGLSLSGGTLTSTITQYTDALARAAISLTTTGTSGAATYNSTTGVFNIPNYATGGGGADALGRYIVQIATNAPANAQILGSLGTGIVKNTTTTGVLSIAVAGDFPTLNQSTTGSAATLTTPRAIYGNNFDGSAALTQIIASTYGGTGNGFTKFSGPATAEKTFTLPDATTTILTLNYTGALATGIVKVTTTTGALTTAVAGDFPTLNQSTTGSAATLTTSRNIQGVAFNGSANIDIINGTGFVKASGTTISYDNSTYLTTSSAASTYQPLDTDLTTIAGLTATTDNFIVSVSSAWASRTPAQVKTTLALDNVTNESKATMFTSPTFTGTPVLGAATGTSLVLSSFLNEAKGADIASATTTDIGAATGNYVNVTGTTTITGLGTVQAGTRRVVQFSGALTLTHNSTSLILPGAANITTVAGDVAAFVSLGTGNWKCISYTKTTTTGTGSSVFATSPTFVTPTLGAATATTLNGLTVTTTAGTLTIANNASASLITSGNFALTLTATATTNSTFPAGTRTLVSLDGTEALTNKNLNSGTNTFPTFNQNTTGSAATLTTARAIYGNNFDGSAALTQIIASTFGGTGNGFTKFSGPATAEKTFTLPNATATILTDNAAVTLAQGGTGQVTANAALNALLPLQTGNTGKYLMTDGSNTSWSAPAGSGDMILASTQTNTGAKTFNSATLIFAGSTSGTTTLNANAIAGSGTVVLPLTGTIATLAGTETFTNKRITKRTGTTTSSATPTINTDNVDYYSLTAQAVDITSFTTNISGTPTEGQTLWIVITGTAARAITWGTSFEASTVALPTTTVTTNRLDVGFIWNSVTSKWRCVASA